jgi:uncharacterized protein YjiS (DUF1127 family)
MTILTFRRPLSTAASGRPLGIKTANSWAGDTRHMIGRWIARSRQRRALREIAEANDFHLLKDIGVSQEEAFREAEKPFWRQ